MEKACIAAQHSFKFFWRELSWERRRIVPALDMAMVKLPFTDGPRSDENPQFEFMWVDQVDFDGNVLSGSLLNSPNWLSSVKEGDAVSLPFENLVDWMMTSDGQAYGAYTVNLMRSRMNPRDRKEHDQAWGLDFGDPNQIRIELNPAGRTSGSLLSGLLGRRGASRTAPGAQAAFVDHPMCLNMLPKIESQLKHDASIVTTTDDRGWTLLHSESLAGNFAVVRLLVRYGADPAAKTPDGRVAADLAGSIGWEELAAYLTNDATADQK